MLGSPSTTPSGRAERAEIRLGGMVLLAAAAAIHVFEARGASPVSLAISFLASAVGMFVGVGLLLSRAPRLGWIIGGGTALLTFAGYCVTRTVGIPGMDPSSDIGNWLEPLGVVSLIVEAAAVILAACALSDRHRVKVAHIVAEVRATAPGLAEA